MKNKGEKLTALFLVFFLLVIAGNLSAAERKGVRLVIQKTDGQEVIGELVTVKSDSLLLLAEDREDITVNINVIDDILVDNKSLMFELGVMGFIAAAATRLVLHSSLERVDAGDETATSHQVQDVFYLGAMGGVVGVLAGGIVGINKRIQIQGESEADIRSSLEKLSKKARVRGIQ